jgi:hypothetical protein
MQTKMTLSSGQNLAATATGRENEDEREKTNQLENNGSTGKCSSALIILLPLLPV